MLEVFGNATILSLAALGRLVHVLNTRKIEALYRTELAESSTIICCHGCFEATYRVVRSRF